MLYREFRYIGFCSINFTVSNTLAGLKGVVRYTEDVLYFLELCSASLNVRTSTPKDYDGSLRLTRCKINK